MKIHLVIHVSNLKPYHLDIEDPSHNQPTRPKVNLSRLEKKVVDDILAEREFITRGCQIKEFLMKWRGLRDEETNWEKENDLLEFKEFIEAFQAVESMRTWTN